MITTRLQVHHGHHDNRTPPWQQLSKLFATALVVTASLAVTNAITHAQSCPPTIEFQKLTSPDGMLNGFGHAVAIDGDHALIANWYGTTCAAYIFDVNTGTELWEFPLTNDSGNLFAGLAVSLDGNRALVGAPGADQGGAAYLFDITTGEQLFQFNNPDYLPDSWFDYFDFGQAVALEGNHALISSYGSAYVFDLTTGENLYTFVSSDGSESWDFGAAVALDGNRAIVGQPYDAWDDHADNGIAYVYNLDTGNELFKLTPNDATEYNEFGTSVALRGNHAVVGAPGDDYYNGAAYVFDLKRKGKQSAKLMPNPDHYSTGFGYSLALDGDLAAVGFIAGWDDPNPVYLFDIITGAKLTTMIPSTGLASDSFGSTVAVNGNHVIIGADNAQSGNGAAYIFDASPEFAITPTPLQSRQAVEFTACGLKPRKPTWLLYTYDGLDPQLHSRLNITVDLLNPRKLRKRKSDSAGNVTWQLRAPRAKTAPKNVWFQVAQKGRVSDYIATQILP